ESPNVRKTTVMGTVQIPDGAPILMPVAYLPPGKGGLDRVWVLVARPIVRIEEEVKVLGEKAYSPASVWDSEVPKEEQRVSGRRVRSGGLPLIVVDWKLPKEEPPVPPPTLLPSTDEVREILQAVLTDVLTNPDLKDT